MTNLIASTSIAFLFKTLLDWRYGTFNQIISGVYKLFGAHYNPVDWLGSGATAGPTIAVISAWMWFGNSFIMLMAGVQGISKDYFETKHTAKGSRHMTQSISGTSLTVVSFILPEQVPKCNKNALRFLLERFNQVGDYLFSQAVSS